jgi:uncharacterized protein
VDNSDNPLDNSAVHPESYTLVEAMAKDLKMDVSQLIRNKEVLQKIDPKHYVSDTAGLPTLNDILQELERPGRDPRNAVKVFEFDANIKSINDLRPGMELPGIVTNVTNFGAFVDIGIKENGLIHVSNLSDSYVSNPAGIVSLHQYVQVKVLDVDVARKRIQLKLQEPRTKSQDKR